MALVRFYSASVNKLHNVLQTGIYSHAPMKPNPSPGGRNFILTSLFLGLTFRPVFSHVFPGRFSPVDLSRDQCCRPVRQGRVMRFCGVRERERERGPLCSEAAAGAAVTVAVLLLASHCSRDEVHRCSHSVQWFIGCLRQCISVRINSS